MKVSDKSMTYADLAWAAGFIEGEGSFSARKGSVTINAAQVQREPLERLQHLFGGSVREYANNRGRTYHRWDLHGSYGIGVMFSLYGFMSPRRREQMRRVIAHWKARPGRNNSLKTHCPQGHEYTPENTYRYPQTGKRACRACFSERPRLAMEA